MSWQNKPTVNVACGLLGLWSARPLWPQRAPILGTTKPRNIIESMIWLHNTSIFGLVFVAKRWRREADKAIKGFCGACRRENRLGLAR